MADDLGYSARSFDSEVTVNMGALILLVLLVAMWLVLIIPQQRRLRAHRVLVSSLSVGDDVMMTSGLYGTITGTDDDDLFLEISPGVEVRVARASVGERVEYEDDPVADDDQTRD